MKKLLLGFTFGLTIIGISGCGTKAFSGPSDRVSFGTTTQASLFSQSIQAGTQIKPGNMELTLDNFDTSSIGVQQDNKITVTVTVYDANGEHHLHTDGSFSDAGNEELSQMPDAYQELTDRTLSMASGDTIKIPMPISDQAVVSVGTVSPHVHGFIDPSSVGGSINFTLKSDGSIKSNDNWRTDLQDPQPITKTLVSTPVDPNQLMHQNPEEILSVGKDVNAGYVKYKCESSETGVCELNSSFKLGDSDQQTTVYFPQKGQLQVGEEYIFAIPVTNGMQIISSAYHYPTSANDLGTNPQLNEQVTISTVSTYSK